MLYLEYYIQCNEKLELWVFTISKSMKIKIITDNIIHLISSQFNQSRTTYIYNKDEIDTWLIYISGKQFRSHISIDRCATCCSDVQKIIFYRIWMSKKSLITIGLWQSSISGQNSKKNKCIKYFWSDPSS